MSKPKHTRGPWSWWDAKSGRPENYDLARLNGPNGECVLKMYGGAGANALGKLAISQANARLIAACPELLEIVTLLKRFKDEGSDRVYFSALSDGNYDVTLGELVDAAIAKATGGDE